MKNIEDLMYCLV